MKRPLDTTTSIGRGSVNASEIYTMREAGRRLAMAHKLLCDAQRQGLRTILFGRQKYVLGSDLIAFFRGLAERQAGEREGGGE
jgi:hypothetical protein